MRHIEPRPSVEAPREKHTYAQLETGSTSDGNVVHSRHQTREASKSDYEELFEFAPDGYLYTDARGRILDSNRAAAALFAVPRAMLIGKPIVQFVDRRSYGSFVRSLARAKVADAIEEWELWLNRWRQEPFPAAVTVAPARGADRRLVGLRWLIRDVTARHHMEERLRASLAEKDLLLKEVYHRVRNNLQVVGSILNLQSHRVRDPAAVEMLKEARNRIRSMALVHDGLYRSQDLSHVELSRYISGLVAELARAYGAPPERVRFTIDVSKIDIGIDLAIPCGMIIHELVSNALRHAFAERAKGVVTISMSQHGENGFGLVVSDDGVGLPAATDPFTHASLGLALVRMLVDQLGGAIEVRRERGTEFRITLPASPMYGREGQASDAPASSGYDPR